MTAGKYSGWCLWRLTTSAALMVLVFVAPALLTPALITPAWAHTQEPPKIKALFSGGMTGGRITVKNFQNQPYDFEIVAYINYQNENARLFCWLQHFVSRFFCFILIMVMFCVALVFEVNVEDKIVYADNDGW